MAIIPLRNTVYAARLAKEVSKTTGESLNLSQKVIATLYGYRSWEQLTASISNTAAEPFVFDQDLSEDERNKRLLAQAQNLTAVLDCPLSMSIDIARHIRVTDDKARPACHYPDEAFYAALATDDDSWWASQYELGHPLAPPGFDIVRIVNNADLSKRRMERAFFSPLDAREHFVLLPANVRSPFYPYSSHLHARLDSFDRVSRVPWSFVFENNKAVPLKKADFWMTLYESADAARSAISEYRQMYSSAIAAAKQVNMKLSMGQQIPTAIRVLLGKGDPLWPLKPLCESAVQHLGANELRRRLLRSM